MNDKKVTGTQKRFETETDAVAFLTERGFAPTSTTTYSSKELGATIEVRRIGTDFRSWILVQHRGGMRTRCLFAF